MNQGLHESVGQRIAFGIIAAIIAGVGTLVVEAIDFLFWDLGWVEADSLSLYIRKVWFVPVGLALIALGMGIWKGSDALDFAKDIWTDIW